MRAEIRNAKTDALIERVNLTDMGSRRFRQNWQVTTVIPEGGLWISVMSAVYTDSGYTTPSDAYSQEIDTYLVEPRRTGHFGGGGGGISRKDLREVLREVVPELLPDVLDQDALVRRILGGVESKTAVVAASIDGVAEQVRSIDIRPEVKVTTQKVDIGAVLEAVESVRDVAGSSAGIIDVRLSEFSDTMLSAIDTVEKRLSDDRNVSVEKLREIATETFNGFREMFKVIAGKRMVDTLDSMELGTEKKETVQSPEEMIRDIAMGKI